MNERISGRIDMLNSINAALQNVSARSAESKPYRISDLIPRNWEGSNEKGEFRSFMSDLHLVWMQAWSDQGQQIADASVQSIDKFDNNVLAFDCSDEEFRSIEASLYQVLHRTTANEPLRIVRSEEYVRQKFSVCSADQQHLQWRLGWEQKKMERMRAKKETRGSWMSLCRLSTKELAKESGTLAKVRTGTRKVATMEERTHGRRAEARKEAKGKRKVARESPERVGRVARQDTLQLEERRKQKPVRHGRR